MSAIRLRGLGLVSCHGRGVSHAVEAMAAGRTGITPLTRFDAPFRDPVRVSQIDHEPYPPGEAGALAVIETAVREALAAAGLGIADLHDAALIIGTSGFLYAAEAEYRYQQSRAGDPDPRPLQRAPGHIPHQLARQLGVAGPVLTLSTACASSANALLVAAEFVRRGEVRRALVIGVEGLSTVALSGFHSLMLLDPDGCRPFDVRRRGMQLGEAVAAIVIESATVTSAGADFLLGGANLCDIHHVTSASPDGSAMRAVMEMALADAGLRPDDVTLIKAHGTGSPDNDQAEAAAMRSLWNGKPPRFTAIKRYLGHTLGACGAVELVALLGCLRSGFVPPGAGYEQPDPELKLAPLTATCAAPTGAVMFNYFGFGGNYASLLVGHG